MKKNIFNQNLNCIKPFSDGVVIPCIADGSLYDLVRWFLLSLEDLVIQKLLKFTICILLCSTAALSHIINCFASI